MLDRFSVQSLLEAVKPGHRFVITEALLLACSGAVAQQTGTAPAINSPASQTDRGGQPDSNTWKAPPGSQITVDRHSGRITITLPVQPAD